MQERWKQLKAWGVEFWNKYSKKQKTIVISVAVTVVIALCVLGFTLNQSSYVELIRCEDTKSASEVVDLLQAEGIDSEYGNDYKTVLVEQSSYKDAVIVVGKNDIPGTGLSYEDALNNDMGTTSEDRERKFTLAMQNDIRQKLLMINGVKDAVVYINQPEDDFTILSEEQQATVSAILTIDEKEPMSAETAANIASFLASTVGNKDTKLITIIDDKGNMLFGGESDSMLGGNVSSIVEYKDKLTNNIINSAKKVLLKTGTISDVEIGSNIKFDMNKISELYTEYTPADGQEQGLLDSSYSYESEGANNSGGVPGTDANGDDTTYEFETGDSSDSRLEVNQNKYKPNEKVTNTEYEIGAVVPDESSMAIVLTSYKVIKQEDLERRGELEGTTWEDYIIDNNTKQKLEVDQDIYDSVAKATGIAEKNLSITAWELPVFQEKEQEGKDYSTLLLLALGLLIAGLLIFVVVKGTAPVEVTEKEPELSVEQLLASTKENQEIQGIEIGDKSETRKLIEKFVDENPEAAANLLRNWLNEDWGEN